jgi:isoquinoline 1-oxidoreductase beta subunit
MTRRLTRREFLRVSSLAGGGLLVAVWLPGCTTNGSSTSTGAATTLGDPTTTTAGSTTTTVPEADPEARVVPGIHLAVHGTGEVTVTAFRSEMGQGIRTAIAMILAEELDADWASVRIEQAPADPDYGSQVTGGSVSVSEHYDLLRAAGATARRLLVETAAELWNVDPEVCATDAGRVLHPDGERAATYGELAGPASQRPLPSREPALKSPSAFRIIGSPLGLFDAPAQVTGRAPYTSDVAVPGMRYAAVAHCPVLGGRARSFRLLGRVPGVLGPVAITAGVAVVAEHTWAAFRGLDALEGDWDTGEAAALHGDDIRAGMAARLGEAAPDESDYFIPYLPHHAMEPMACVADAGPDRCEVWAPTQDPQDAAARVRASTGLPLDAITVHVPLIGGRFGRGHHNDVVDEAVEISLAIEAPVKVVWRREDDLRNDRYHPMRLVRASAADGRIRLRTVDAAAPVPTGPWRSVGEHPEAFARQSFVAERAAAAGRDALEACLEAAPEEGRACIEAAADRAGWGTPLPDGSGRGVAYHATFGATHVAQVAEVTVAGGRIRVDRVVCAVDCGTVVNPDTVAAQMEGGIAFGLTAALLGGITIAGGGVVEGNFDDCPILTYDEMPTIEVIVMPSRRAPSGVGEMGVPPIAPAVANAAYAAAGTRMRSLPLTLPAG